MEEKCIVLRYLETPGSGDDTGVTFRGAAADLETGITPRTQD